MVYQKQFNRFHFKNHVPKLEVDFLFWRWHFGLLFYAQISVVAHEACKDKSLPLRSENTGGGKAFAVTAIQAVKGGRLIFTEEVRLTVLAIPCALSPIKVSTTITFLVRRENTFQFWGTVCHNRVRTFISLLLHWTGFLPDFKRKTFDTRMWRFGE